MYIYGVCGHYADHDPQVEIYNDEYMSTYHFADRWGINC